MQSRCTSMPRTQHPRNTATDDHDTSQKDSAHVDARGTSDVDARHGAEEEEEEVLQTSGGSGDGVDVEAERDALASPTLFHREIEHLIRVASG